MRIAHRALRIAVASLAVLAGLAMMPAILHAQFTGVTQDLIGRGQLEYSDAVGGPADVYVGWILMDPGSNYGGWHTHPGPVWVIVTGGELTVYGPNGCPTLYRAGAAYVAQPDTLYDLRNETDQPVALAFAGIFRVGQPPILAGDAPGQSC